VAAKKPITPETLFQLASVSKTVTVCAILQQVEKKLLDLDADINEVLPFKVRHPEHPEIPITLRALLTHTASIRDNWTILEDTWVKDVDFPIPLGLSLKQYLVTGEKWYKARKNFQRWAPGKRNEYSNIGIALAAYVAEVAAKQPFEQLCEKGIFTPLKMTRSSYRLKSLKKSEIAIPHQWKGGKQNPVGHHGYLDYPAGTLRTSAPQLGRFLLCIMNEGELDGKRILSQKMVREMLRVQYPEIEDTQALVWFRESEEDGTFIGHDGSDPGVLTMMFFNLEKKSGFILLMNGEPKGRGIDDEIMEIMIPILIK
jgi:CubicO group peptidase (beta-lactamase class C family)